MRVPALLLLLAAAGCSRPPELRLPEGGVRLPAAAGRFGLFQVEGELPGGGRIPFILDTGADRSTVDEAAVRALALEPRRLWIPRPHLRAGGMKWVTRHVLLERMGIGEAEVRGLDLRVGEFCLLGTDVTRRCALLVDRKAGELRLLPSEGLEAALGRLYPGLSWSRHPLRDGQKAVFETAAGVRVEMVVDTGANVSVMTAATIRALGLGRESPNALRRFLGKAEEEGDPEFRVNAFEGSPGVRVGVVRMEGLKAGGAEHAFPACEGGPDLLSLTSLGDPPHVFDGPGRTLWIGATRSSGAGAARPSAP